MDPKLQSMLAQFNAGQARVADMKVQDERVTKKAPAKGDGDGAKVKLKLKVGQQAMLLSWA